MDAATEFFATATAEGRGRDAAAAVRLPPPPPPPPAGAVRVRPTRFERMLSAFVATVGCAVFVTACRIDPYDAAGQPRTHGTHRQLGMPPCTLLAMTGFPCPACGMTTAVSLLAHGDPAAAWRANWAGVFVAGLGLAATVWLGLLACGVPRRPAFAAESTILALTLAGAAVALVRYVGVVGVALASGRP